MDDVIRDGFDDLAGRESRAESRGSVLDRVRAPADLRTLSPSDLERLCGEIRDYIIDVVSQKGGHLGASLGVVELTVALARVLDLPRDRIVWDTGHQAYVYKVLTGRKDALWSIRQYGGISGFLKREESPFDTFGAGHASTAISAALGVAAARDLAKETRKVVAVMGDGAMTGGLAYEALNNAGHSGRDLLVVLNDNGMSISPNVGALAHYLTGIQMNPRLRKWRHDGLAAVSKLPRVGGRAKDLATRLESAIKTAIVPGGLFEALGFNYIGPVDGHDLPALLDLLPKVLDRRGPVLLHVMTRKGKGLPVAEADHEGFHGVSPFDKVTGKAIAAGAGSSPGYTAVFGKAMLEAAAAFPRMVAITAAMPTGTGLSAFQERFPDRFYDVGIAEAHGVCFAAGLGCEGARPVVTIYSTFLQRAFDQIVHDVALQHVPVVFAIDRAGLVGADGPTHHGVLDLSYLRCVPGLVVAAPRDGNELRDLLWTGLSQEAGPFAIRYPRDTVPAGFEPDRAPRVLTVGSWEVLAEGRDLSLLAVGAMVETAKAAREALAVAGIDAGLVNCRFVKPVDRALLRSFRASSPLLVTIEENSVRGGFADAVTEALLEDGGALGPILALGLPDAFVTHGSRGELLAEVGLDAEGIASRVRAALAR
ncbi:MAG TPA: 1-deoxy-D-xylulose-5-phosphate synthase [Candidatus Polarisedimenticolaceae bacterium]|nr:1-deoxy-D-xylulose-5-phosphate synthase [Candidatus Polarisedimenticolaceae bacterium]